MKYRPQWMLAVVTVGSGALYAGHAAAQQVLAAYTDASGRALSADYVAPRTAGGQPDLQGFWTNDTYVPFERPRDEERAYFTVEEVIEREQRSYEREASQTVPGTTADVHYDFTQFGLDRSQSGFIRNLRTSQIIDPPDGRIPALSPEGERRQGTRTRGGPGTDTVKNMSEGTRCIKMGSSGPPMTVAGYNSNFHIVQAPAYVMVMTEMIHEARVIPLDGQPAPPEGTRHRNGFSRGHWEGETLVVETTNFSDKFSFRGSSENLKVTERFTRVADDMIVYQFTVEDPATWVRPWTAELPMTRINGPLFEFSCHETNYGIFNTLAGAREEERLAAEAAAAGNN